VSKALTGICARPRPRQSQDAEPVAASFQVDTHRDRAYTTFQYEAKLGINSQFLHHYLLTGKTFLTNDSCQLATVSIMKDHGETWSVVRSVLQENFRFGEIKAMVGFAGLNMPRMAEVEYNTSGRQNVSKSQLLSAIDRQVGEMPEQRLVQFVRIATEEMLRRQPEIQARPRHFLERLGWTLYEGHIVEVAALDVSDLPELPPDAHGDLLKAATRLRDGDLSGAVSAACAAVDAVTSRVYESQGLGNPGQVSFQTKVCQSLRALNTIAEVERQLVELGWKQQDAAELAQNVRGSLNQAAFVLQSLRSKMGDVHGTKPILKPIVFDSIKWAMLITHLLASP
jgi:hypothetical protein